MYCVFSATTGKSRKLCSVVWLSCMCCVCCGVWSWSRRRTGIFICVAFVVYVFTLKTLKNYNRHRKLDFKPPSFWKYDISPRRGWGNRFPRNRESLFLLPKISVNPSESFESLEIEIFYFCFRYFPSVSEVELSKSVLSDRGQNWSD